MSGIPVASRTARAASATPAELTKLGLPLGVRACRGSTRACRGSTCSSSPSRGRPAMPSSWLERRETKAGDSRYRVRYLLGGREERPRYAGSFKTKTEALARKRWVDGELAAMRVPEISLVDREPELAPLLRDVAARWLESRIDVADHTRRQHRSDVNRAGDLLDRRVDEITAGDVAELVAKLAETRKRET